MFWSNIFRYFNSWNSFFFLSFTYKCDFRLSWIHHLRFTSCFLYGVGRRSPLFSAVSFSILRPSISSSMHLLQLFFGLPIGLLPGTSILIDLPMALPSPLLFTWPNHLNLFLLNLLSMSSTSIIIIEYSIVQQYILIYILIIWLLYIKHMQTFWKLM